MGAIVEGVEYRYLIRGGWTTLPYVTRIHDGPSVMFEKVLPEEGPHELRISQLPSSPEHSKERNNHRAPLLDATELPAYFGSQKPMVLPLFRPFNRPRIQTFGVFDAFFTQICEVRQILHVHTL
ncbi:hypothetical protein EDB85DRAFT_2033914 [Lactarius pseudohatsudake]|nr:hypothetical protein EDB85DRAFT_2033914 [Lactarius pseudohatsudake]